MKDWNLYVNISYVKLSKKKLNVLLPNCKIKMVVLAPAMDNLLVTDLCLKYVKKPTGKRYSPHLTSFRHSSIWFKLFFPTFWCWSSWPLTIGYVWQLSWVLVWVTSASAGLNKMSTKVNVVIKWIWMLSYGGILNIKIYSKEKLFKFIFIKKINI